MTRTEHIGKLADLLSILNRLIKGIVKVVRAKYCNVSIVGFLFFIRVTVNNGKVIIVVFLAYKAAGILAEGSYLVFKRLRVAYEL